MPTLDETITEVLAPVFAPGTDLGGALVLDQVEVSTAGRRRVVRVVVDAAGDDPGEIDLDAVAAVSTAISQTLDETNALGDTPYTLEVSSPGVDRPLTTRRHWSRARGRLVRAVLTGGSDLMLRVVSVDDDGVHGTGEPQMVKGKPPRAKDVGAPHDLAWADLVRGEVQIEFRRGEDDIEDLVADETDDGDETLENDENPHENFHENGEDAQ